MDIYDDDIDGIPLTNDDDDIDGVPIDDSKTTQRAFIPSKWETVDPDQIEAQAVTTSKWDTLPVVVPDPPKIVTASSDDSDSSDSNLGYEDERRTILREIEVKTMQYQDDLEAGRRSLKPGYTLNEQVHHYRKKLIKKVKRKQENSSDSSERERYREPSPPVISSVYAKKGAKRSKRSPSSPAGYERDYDRSNSPRSTRSYKSRSPLLSRRQESESPQSSSHSSSRRYKERAVRSRSRSPHHESLERGSRRFEREVSPGRRYKSPSPTKSLSSRYHEVSRDRERYTSSLISSSSSSSHKKHKRSKY